MAASSLLQLLATAIVLLVYSECLPVEEPKCSKFDFEEKLLEKMVRMEHSGGVMMKEFQEIAASVKDDLGKMKREFDEIKREVQEERISNERRFQEYVKRPSYAFNANFLNNHDPNVGDALVFKNVLLNEEDVYKKNTGEYSVKVNGTYAFFATLCFQMKGYAYIRFLADDRVLGNFRVGDKDWYLCSSSTTVAYLSIGSKVRLDLAYKSKNNIFSDHTGQYHCSFSGHLIE